MKEKKPCEPHTENKLGYGEMSHWAGVLHRAGYRQRRCVGCGLFKIWYHRDTKQVLTKVTLTTKTS